MKIWATAVMVGIAVSPVSAAAQQRPVKVAIDPSRQSSAQSAEPNRFMRVFGTALPPYAFVEFCQRSPEHCAADAQPSDTRLEGTQARLRLLDDINRSVNRTIKPMTDIEQYGVEDYWGLPTSGHGDCEDYALLKRKILIDKGWPISSLLMTVVRDEKGDGHAILTARMSTGDYVLDNKVDDLKLWSQTPYQYVMRQSYLNPRVWMSLDPRDGAAPASLAGLFGIR